MTEDFWNDNVSEAEQVVKITEAIHLLIDGCTQNLTPDQLQVIKERNEATIQQCTFWEKQGNRQRFLYDLREFGMWLADFIGDAEEKFWDKENNP